MSNIQIGLAVLTTVAIVAIIRHLFSDWDHCSDCGERLEYRGFHQEKSYCPNSPHKPE